VWKKRDKRACVVYHYSNQSFSLRGGIAMSIVRIGLAETKKFAEGYASIFGSKKKNEEKPAEKATKDDGKKKAAKKKKK
jgi:hypothetical protein